MKTRSLSVAAVLLYGLLFGPANAHAQYGATPFHEPSTGEKYHIEAALEFWDPPLDLKVKSQQLCNCGTEIDAATDLGLTRKHLTELRLVVRPAKKHKFRLNYLPMKYNGQSTLHRSFVFNGQTFGINLPLTTDLQWTTWLVAYEYDFLYTDKWFAGLTLNSKFTKVSVDIAGPSPLHEFALAQAPVPTIGGVARVYVVPNISITADINGIKIPDSLNTDYKAHYFDFDLYGTVNFNDYVGAQVGYRDINVGYKFKQDEGTFKMKGLYFGGVVRY